MHFYIILFCSLVSYYCNAIETCSNEDNRSCSTTATNRYSKDRNTKYQKYLDLIYGAKNSYEPCTKNDCQCYIDVIEDDLRRFRKGISREALNSIKSRGTTYQIIDHKLYREKACMFPARCAGIEHFILELLPQLPDMELVVNTRDWPRLNKYDNSAPMFSFSKTRDYKDVMYPAWAFWEGGPAISLYPKGIGRWDEHRLKVGKVGNETAWSDKIPKGFFRGSRTSDERDALVYLSRENPDLVDAQYTKNQAWKSDADTLSKPPAAEVTFEDHCKYKYLFNFRGVAASFRFKHILLCKSVVFHVGNEWLEFFYPALKPWIHYIPIKTEPKLKEIQELLEFARDNDEVVKEIAEAGYNFIWNHLKLSDVSCYWRVLLQKYAKLIRFQPLLDENFIEIK